MLDTPLKADRSDDTLNAARSDLTMADAAAAAVDDDSEYDGHGGRRATALLAAR